MTSTTHRQKQNLRDAIAVLYDTFSAYPLRPYLKGAPCCADEVAYQRMQVTPLQHLTAFDLNRFACNVLTVWGMETDYKHFLPRLLELIAFDARNFYWSELVIGKLNSANWRNWPRAERRAVEYYLMALWEYILSEYTSPSIEASAFLISVGQVTDDLKPFLEVWRKTPSVTAIRHLTSLIWWDFDLDPDLDREPELEQQRSQEIRNWLCEPDTLQCLQQAFCEHRDGPLADDLDMAVEILAGV